MFRIDIVTSPRGMLNYVKRHPELPMWKYLEKTYNPPPQMQGIWQGLIALSTDLLSQKLDHQILTPLATNLFRICLKALLTCLAY